MTQPVLSVNFKTFHSSLLPKEKQKSFHSYMQVRQQVRPLWSHPNGVIFLSLALNLIGPRAVDVLSELSYAPITPEHFPSLFCKVSGCASSSLC